MLQSAYICNVEQNDKDMTRKQKRIQYAIASQAKELTACFIANNPSFFEETETIQLAAEQHFAVPALMRGTFAFGGYNVNGKAIDLHSRLSFNN